MKKYSRKVILACSAGCITLAALMILRTSRKPSPMVPRTAVSSQSGRPTQLSGQDDSSLAPSPRTSLEPAANQSGNAGSAATPSDLLDAVTTSRDALADNLKTVLATFRTETPALNELEDLVFALGANATIDTNTLLVTEEYGVARGDIVFANSDLTASFSINQDQCTITINLDEAPSEPVGAADPYGSPQVQFTFDSGTEETSSYIVQYHPNTNQSAFPAKGVEAITGWTVRRSGSDRKARPLSIKRMEDGESVIVGHANAFEEIKDRANTPDFILQGWESLLDPYTKK